MKRLHQMVAVGAVMSVGLCSVAKSQVLDQVPAKAAGVFEVKNLHEVSDKVAKFAKTLGIDQFQPQFADPLAAMEDSFGLKQGINADGDLAIAFFPTPKKEAGENPKSDDPPVVVFVPTSDYKAFLTNFTNAKDAGNGISQVTVPKNQETLFIVSRGKYAEAAMDKALLSEAAGFKLSPAAAKEAAAKDAIVYFDIEKLRPQIDDALKEGQKFVDQQKTTPGGNGLTVSPQLQKIMGLYVQAAQTLVKSTDSAAISLNITDTGIGFSSLADMNPQSDLGKLVAQVKNTDEPLLAGLPDLTYFGFGGAKLTPEVSVKFYSDFVLPVIHEMLAGKETPEMTKGLQAMKDSLAVTKDMTFGYVSKGGAPGEGLIGMVGVVHGDANKMLENQKATIPAANSIMLSGSDKTSVTMAIGEPTTVDGVNLMNFTMKFSFDPNNPGAAGAKEVTSILYGRDGLAGSSGKVNDNTMITLIGANDKLTSDAIAAAKTGADVLDQNAGVKKIAGELPKQRVMEGYVALDNIANAAVKVAKQQGLPVQFRLPPNLPPIGFSIGTDGTTVRTDMVISTQLIQSITAAAMQAVMQQNGGPGAQGGGI